MCVCKCVSIYMNISIGLMSCVLVNDPGHRDSIQCRVISKTQKMVHDATLLNNQHYKVKDQE